MAAYIEFKDVVKRFGDFTALDHVSLEIPKGSFVTLLGPSGCGKTTLMRQLAGFSEPEEGDVLVVLEAMKMENDIMAPKNGTVTQVLVEKGSTVETGAPLVFIR